MTGPIPGEWPPGPPPMAPPPGPWGPRTGWAPTGSPGWAPPGPPPTAWTPHFAAPLPGPAPAAVPARRLDVGRLVSASILAGLGAVVGRVVLDGSYTAYVRPIMRLPLGLAAVVLLVAGIAGYVSAVRPAVTRRSAPHDHHHHGGRVVSRAALLALVPLAVLALLRPPALDDAATDSVAPAASGYADDTETQIAPLPGDPDTPKAMTFSELALRGISRGGPETLQGRVLALEGFVAKSQTGAPAGTVRIGRYKIWCCAADATFSAAFVRWPTGTPTPTPGSWFDLTGRVDAFQGNSDTFVVPVLEESAVRQIRTPKNQYEY